MEVDASARNCEYSCTSSTGQDEPDMQENSNSQDDAEDYFLLPVREEGRI